jgi:tetratricopeptide (TPR) repeat protein
MTTGNRGRANIPKTGNTAAQLMLAGVLSDMGRSGEALARFQQAISNQPDNAQAHSDLASKLHDLGRPDDAVSHFRQALAIEPDYAAAHLGLGVVLAAVGKQNDAKRSFEKAIELEPASCAAYFHLGLASRFSSDNHHFLAMQQLAEDMTALSPENQIYLHFALAKAYRDLGDYDRSFHHLLKGNGLKRHQAPYFDRKKLNDRVQAVFSSVLMQNMAGTGNPSPRPVFIVGMHRSGSTLVEQILASHPKCFGAGELFDISELAKELRGPDGAEFPESMPSLSERQLPMLAERYLATLNRMSPTAERVTDKMPGNFAYIGLIHLMFPNARIIHTRRDPRDTAISCFSTKDLVYLDLAELGRFYRNYRSLMSHWRRVIPDGVILEVDYELLVDDFDTQARRIVSHCGLEWHDACTAFYRNERPVMTASVGQVHQPIYRSSVGRWQGYEKFLQPFLEALDGE